MAGMNATSDIEKVLATPSCTQIQRSAACLPQVTQPMEEVTTDSWPEGWTFARSSEPIALRALRKVPVSWNYSTDLLLGPWSKHLVWTPQTSQYSKLQAEQMLPRAPPTAPTFSVSLQ